jgi:hypothetical protein
MEKSSKGVVDPSSEKRTKKADDHSLVISFSKV